MKLSITKFGNPILRRKGGRLQRFDKSTAELVNNMIETMFYAKGIGLAAQQVGLALQLAIVWVGNQTSYLRINGEEADPATTLPIILINPVITTFGDPEPYEEGCLSIKGIHHEVIRQPNVKMETIWNPLKRKPEPTIVECDGLTARAILHEADHLNGVLFTDHLPRNVRDEISKVVKRK